jgi:lipoprotein-anchoring transpeptidase ErfK/SrfK
MNAQIKKFFLPVLTSAVLFAAGFSATAQAAKAQTATHRAKPAGRRVVVSLPDRKLALVENGKVKKVYVVAVGKKSTPSPTGTFTIMTRVVNPSYSHDGEVVAPGPGNPVGTRWMGLSAKGYGIHGTNAPRSIGKAASRGCIRMRKDDLEELFAAVEKGDQVEIVGDRDQETAEIFGDEQGTGTSHGAAETTAQAATPAPVQAETTPAVAIAAVMPLAR